MKTKLTLTVTLKLFSFQVKYAFGSRYGNMLLTKVLHNDKLWPYTKFHQNLPTLIKPQFFKLGEKMYLLTNYIYKTIKNQVLSFNEKLLTIIKMLRNLQEKIALFFELSKKLIFLKRCFFFNFKFVFNLISKSTL